MASVRTIQQSFVSGEISPEMLGRNDDVKYGSALATCRNFITKAQGPVEKRPGFTFVRAIKDSTKRARLIPFTYSTTQTMVIELGAGYFRFHTQGATLLNAGVPYEIGNPYAEADIFDIHYVQSADVVTLVHPKYAPRELRRLGATNWQLSTITFSASIVPPGPPICVASGHTTARYNYTYVVTATDSSGVGESVASTPTSVSGNLFETGGVVTVTWSAVPGASRYNVYKLQAGLYGYIGQTTGVTLVDDNIAPDLSTTPPIHDPVFVKNGIQSVPITSGGSGYGSSLAGGVVTSVGVVSGGSGYTSAPTINLSDATGSGASLSASIDAYGAVSGVSVVGGGVGYSAPSAYASGSGGNGAEFSVTSTAITNRRVVLQVADATGSGAALEAIVNGGAVIGVRVLNPGSNYTNPTITFADAAGGSGCAFGAAVLTGEDYPSAVSYFEQRRVFAGTDQRPQSLWMTKVGTESNMSYSIPTRDDDRIAFRVAAREANTIRHLVPLSQLIVLTSSAEWQVTSLNSDVIAPSTISVRPQSYVGASNVQPLVVNNVLIYAASRGGHVRELAYNWQSGGILTGDLSLRAAHLFDEHTVVDMSYSKAPQPVVWFVSSSGKLLGFTYAPDQQVGAWHQHDTDGVFESCTVVAEGDEDRLYCVIRRTVNGSDVRYIERMAPRRFIDQVDAFFVDSGATYSGAPATVISGLSHLEGKTVNVLVDGAVHPQCVVSSGTITLAVEGSVVHVGLPYDSDLETLPIIVGLRDGSAGQGRVKNINQVWMRVYRSSGIFVGPDAEHLTEVKQRTTESYGAPPLLKTEELAVTIAPTWDSDGRVFVRHSNPLPLTVVNMTLEVAIGG